MQAWLQRVKNNPLITLLVLVVSVVMSLAAFNSAVRELLQDFMPHKRIAINGEWKADITYDWSNAHYIETFRFMGEGDLVQGSASFLQVPRGIEEGKLQGDQVQWVTLGSEMNDNRVVRNVYRGRINADTLQLTLQIENTRSPHVPIVFTATRVTAAKN